MTKRNVAASVRARLLNHAREKTQDFSLVLTRFCLERLLYRISISDHADHFLLKGALLFDIWFDIPHRPTRDADFLGLGSSELPSIEETFREVCGINVQDGVVFQPETVRATEIRKEANYAGMRVLLQATLDGARCQIQADFDGETLGRAIQATFARRKSNLPAGPPLGLAREFLEDAQKQKQWQAFLRKNALETLSLEDIVNSLLDFLMPTAEAASSGNSFPFHWTAGGPWSSLSND